MGDVMVTMVGDFSFLGEFLLRISLDLPLWGEPLFDRISLQGRERSHDDAWRTEIGDKHCLYRFIVVKFILI